MWNGLLLDSQRLGIALWRTAWHSWSPFPPQQGHREVCKLIRAQVRKAQEMKAPQHADSLLPLRRELCLPIVSNYNCISFFNVFYADIQAVNEGASALWSPLLQLTALNCFVSIADRYSEQLDNNKEARWGNRWDSFILIRLIMHPTALNQG